MALRIMRVLFIMLVVVGWSGGAAQSQSQVLHANAPVSNAITYQGWLQQNGVAVEGLCDLRFALFDAASNGAQVGSTLDRASQSVSGGYFTVSDLDFGATFTGQARWIEVAVRCPAGSDNFTTLTPRQPLTPAPYALHAVNNWSLVGNAGTNSTNNFVGTTDAVTVTFKVSDTVALRLLPNAISPNIVGGIAANRVVSGVVGAVIAGGGAMQGGFSYANRVTDDYGVIVGGSNNQAGDNAGTTSDRSYAVVGGGRDNVASGGLSTLGGGQANAATALYATIGGGVENNALADGTTVGGGAENNATGEYATISGGIENVASASNATVGGGSGNDATDTGATVAGGVTNQATAAVATVGGGDFNQASNSYATVGGGSVNKAAGQSSVVAGGELNEAQGNNSTVSGGNQNIAGAASATVAGGTQNQATVTRATVSGGYKNTASGNASTISGGNDNEVTGTAATIGGGRFNRVSADFATVPGGVGAHASHPGEWAYANGNFTTDGVGEAQSSLYILRGTTTNNQSTILNLSSTTDRLTIAPGRTVVFEIQLAARSTGGESAGYVIGGIIENHLGITALVGTLSITELGEDDANWNVVVSADNVNDSLQIQVTGANGDEVRWVATVRTTEVQN